MKPLIVLFSVFVLSLAIIYMAAGGVNYIFAGQIALSIMMFFTAIGHFKFPKGMSRMIPDFVPYKLPLVYFTGCIEIAAAIGLQIPALRALTGWMLILFFLIILPANINAAIKHLNYETGSYDGKGLSYLWFRVPMQVLLIVWTYLFAINL